MRFILGKIRFYFYIIKILYILITYKRAYKVEAELNIQSSRDFFSILREMKRGTRDEFNIPFFGCEEVFVLNSTKSADYVKGESLDSLVEVSGLYHVIVLFLKVIKNFNNLEVIPYPGFLLVLKGEKQRLKKVAKQVRFAEQRGINIGSELISKNPLLYQEKFQHDKGEFSFESKTNVKLLLIIHLYYDDLIEEFLYLISERPFNLNVIITYSGDKLNLVRHAFSHVTNCEVLQVENKGRDIAPFLQTLFSSKLQDFDFVCKLHGKKSLGVERINAIGTIWRRMSFLELFGTNRDIHKIIELFQANDNVGIIGQKRFLRAGSVLGKHNIVGTENIQNVMHISNLIGCPIHNNEIDFFEGTMFWFRPSIFKNLSDQGLMCRFENEKGHSDGEIEHAIERLFNHIARCEGFDIVSI